MIGRGSATLAYWYHLVYIKKCIQADEAWSFRQYGSVFRQTMNRNDFQVVSPIGSIALSKACTSDSGK